ncbi:MAG: flagellar motor protein MotD [Burkholderiales bacterium]
MKPRIARRVKRAAEDGPHRERWLVSYADFITLMFAFFVVMYATSTVNEGKYRVVSDALFSAFRHTTVAPRVEPVTAPVPPPLPLPRARPPKPAPSPSPAVANEQRLRDLASLISETLKPLVQAGQVRLAQTEKGLAVEINASVLFAPAQAVLQPDSIVALTAVAETLAKVDNPIDVEGHSDVIPIGTAQYPSNWELSSARASSVVRLFIDNGVAPERLVAVGYAAMRPVDSNDTPEGRQRNRRVTLFIRAEPGGR